jgi:hypothetical protein
MGHTVTSQRIVLEVLQSELMDFGKALRGRDRQLFELMMKRGFQHYGAISYTDSFHTWAFLLLAIMLEQEKELSELRKQISDGG